MKKGPCHFVFGMFLILFIVSLELLFSSSMTFPDNWFLAITISFAIYLAAILRLQALDIESERNWIDTISSPDDAHTMARYQNALGELRFTKNLQWNFLYYLLASFGALFAVATAFRGNAETAPVRLYLVLYLLACALEVYGIYFICEIQYKLRSYRIQISKNRFQRENYNDPVKYERDRLNDRRYWRDMRFIVTYLVTAVIAFIIVAAKLWTGFTRILDSLARTILR
jgi:hypothetical protein